ncbi:MAG TPA: YceI family protein [Alphaproteobacteria bacterium]|nr:YceI family protein [Alphaproteobacteria bacterium]
MRAKVLMGMMLMASANVFAADYKFVPPSLDYKTIPAGAYDIDPHHSSVTFRITHMGLSTFTGRFNNVSGNLVFNPQEPTVVNMQARVATANVDTGNPELDSTLKGTAFFDAEHFPTIKFVAKSFELIGPDTGKLLADVTLHGITRSVPFDVVFRGHGKNYEGAETLGFSARGTLKRSAFNMTGFLPAVGDDVELWLESEFNKKS